MSQLRDRYAKTFSKEQARAIETAAEQHANGSNSKDKGSDAFRWAITIVIGYQCVELYAEDHNISVPFDKFKRWVRRHAALGSHDGDLDYLGLMVGVYQPFIKAGTK